jgi:hypothetical protein
MFGSLTQSFRSYTYVSKTLLQSEFVSLQSRKLPSTNTPNPKEFCYVNNVKVVTISIKFMRNKEFTVITSFFESYLFVKYVQIFETVIEKVCIF